ncbi:hypothetical protein E2C01_049509 [Portunus trituberculatus]|uniref:Uncharacterized protein n=1 Tax=Portunus trituberculatus TaxID=210409 RepID=A0A5B7GE28_PORTR|nr:hypothetical protein [Portunus trituberculatus]
MHATKHSPDYITRKESYTKKFMLFRHETILHFSKWDGDARDCDTEMKQGIIKERRDNFLRFNSPQPLLPDSTQTSSPHTCLHHATCLTLHPHHVLNGTSSDKFHLSLESLNLSKKPLQRPENGRCGENNQLRSWSYCTMEESLCAALGQTLFLNPLTFTKGISEVEGKCLVFYVPIL